MIKKYTILTLLFALHLGLFAQVAPGQWKDYLCYAYPSKIAAGTNKAYCIASAGLFTINYSDFSIEKLSKVTGLSDISVSAIAFSSTYNMAIVGYVNGNIDLLTKDNIINLNDLKNKTGISAKKIENIVVSGKFAYLCCGFGILVLNLENKEIADVYQFGINGSALQVNDVCIFNGYIYAATVSGLYKADATSRALADFNNWKLESSIPNSTSNYKWVKATESLLLTGCTNINSASDNFYYWQNNQWLSFIPSTETSYNSLKASKTEFILTGGKHVRKYSSSLQLLTEWEYGAPKDADFEENGNVWTADFYWGVIRKGTNGSYDSFTADSPLSNDVSRVAAHDGKVWIATGKRDVNSTSWNSIYRLAEIHYYDGKKWGNYTSSNIPEFSGYMDISNVVIDPTNENRVFFSAWTAGCLGVFEKEKFAKQWNEKNSTLSIRSISGLNFSRVFGMCFDSNNNLWITNPGLPNTVGEYPISVKTSANKWKSFDFGKTLDSKLMGDIIATANNSKWVILPSNNGLLVFDEKGTFDNTADDEYTQVTIQTDKASDNQSNDAYAIAEDHDGNIWVGTNTGPVVYYNPSAVFSGDNFYASRIQIPRKNSNYVDNLLVNERITSIVIDGGNRKWLGTASSGVFLMSADGITQLLNFTKDNSPLPSNTINTIAIDDVTGEVLISTDQGMVSYRGNATTGGEDFENLYVFPNPVREDYRGDIIISGLIQDSEVRITDLAGSLVYACKSLGGQAVWKGTNFNGRRVNTGVYLVFCSNKDATKTKVTKLLFIH